MKPTKLSALAAAAFVAGAVAYLIARSAYGSLPPLPAYAPVTLVLLALAEAAVARVVRDRLSVRPRDAAGRARGRPLHPIQVARAAVLAKASSPTGAVLFGGYAGYLAWTFPHRVSSVSAARDARVCAVSALSALLLVATALFLERACRAPEPPDLQSPT